MSDLASVIKRQFDADEQRHWQARQDQPQLSLKEQQKKARQIAGPAAWRSLCKAFGSGPIYLERIEERSAAELRAAIEKSQQRLAVQTHYQGLLLSQLADPATPLRDLHPLATQLVRVVDSRHAIAVVIGELKNSMGDAP